MRRKAMPNNVQEYFQQFLAGLPQASRLVVALDPERLLNLNEKIIDPKGKRWAVFHYFENDFGFRVKYSRRPDDPNFPHIVWVTFPRFGAKSKINLSFISDILEGADRIEDFSLRGILSQLIPREKWNPEALAKYATAIASNLSQFVVAHDQLRHYVPKDAPLSIHHVRILTLICLHPGLSVQALMFEELSASEVLVHYLGLAWSGNWDNQSSAILKELAGESPKIDTRSISPWLIPHPQTLALYVYLRQSLERYHVPNPANQLRGLQMLEFAPEELEQQVSAVIAHLGKSPNLQSKMIRLAEDGLSAEDLDRLIQLVSPQSTVIAQVLARESSPAIAYGLAIHFLQSALAAKALSDIILSSHVGADLSSRSRLSEAAYTSRAGEVFALISELADIEEVLSHPPEPTADLNALLDWYIQSRAFRLELAHAKVNHYLKSLGSDQLHRDMQGYLVELLQRVRSHLEKADLRLAEMIEANWQSYLSHPRLSINVLRNTILKPKAYPPYKSRVWILVFDGMRWDTWQEVVKPILAEEFEIAEEKAYVCILPSYTDIARVSLLSGKIPLSWTNYKGKPTSDHHILAARLFNILEAERHEQLRIVTSSETDMGQRRLGFDLDRKPYNILIYNLSDDWIHAFRDSVWELNNVIANKVKDGVLPDLRGRLDEEDVVVVISDHGFIELAKEDEVQITASPEWQGLEDEDLRNPICYRYLKGLGHSDGVRVQYGEDRLFTVARGRKWFGREKGRFTRYAHGGISLSEMVIPGAIIRKIVTPTIGFQWVKVPGSLEVLEDQQTTVEIGIRNNGNRQGDFTLSLEIDTGERDEFEARLKPKQEHRASFTFIPKFSKKLKTTRLTCKLAYTDIAGKQELLSPRVVPIIVTPRKDKVELDTSALEKLDEL